MIWDFHVPHWGIQRHLFMGFLPVAVQYNGPILGCLAGSRGSLPVMFDSATGLYGLDPTVWDQ